jgi:hypothetical protein
MANDKKAFVLNKDWLEVVEKLTERQSGILFKSILRFVNNEAVTIIDDEVNDAYEAIIEQIVFSWSKYNPKTKKYHWNYQGGITPENKVIRNSVEMKYWRLKVFERDNYTCQKCDQRGGVLNAHHVKHFAEYPELRTELSNGITLCIECHKAEHKKEEQHE